MSSGAGGPPALSLDSFTDSMLAHAPGALGDAQKIAGVELGCAWMMHGSSIFLGGGELLGYTFRHVRAKVQHLCSGIMV